MRTTIRRTLCATAVAGGFTVLGIAFAASSASADTTSGADGLVSGNQTVAAVRAPVTAARNQVTVIGNHNKVAATPAPSAGSSSSGQGSGQGSGQSSGQGSSQETSGKSGTGSGNQTGLDAVVPVTPSGNQVTVIGNGNHNAGSARGTGSGTSGASGTRTTDGEQGTGSGNQTDAHAAAPVDASGNQVTVIGNGNRAGSSDAGTTGSGTPAGGTTSGADDTGSGNQTAAGIAAPVDLTGNQVTVIGDGNQQTTASGDQGGASDGDASGSTTTGADGTGSGNQTSPAVTAPIDGSGNQINVIGDGNTTERTVPGVSAAPVDPTDGTITESPANEPTTSSVDAPLGTVAAAAVTAAQAAPAAVVAGVLPQTGAAAHLLVWGLLGLVLLALGLGLVSGRRREAVTGRLRGQGVAQAL